jgi:hypothetical protein
MAETNDDRREEAITYYADRFACEDIDVQADAPGYETPDELNGYRPDILAVGTRRTRRAFAVVTDPKADADKRDALDEWAGSQVRALFRWGVVTDDGTVDRWRQQ